MAGADASYAPSAEELTAREAALAARRAELDCDPLPLRLYAAKAEGKARAVGPAGG